MSAPMPVNYSVLQKPTLDELVVSFAARWSEACATAFVAIKPALVSAPVLALSDPSAHYIMVSVMYFEP